MVLYQFFFAILAKVLFNDAIYNVQKLALIFLLVGPILVWIPIYGSSSYDNPILSYTFVLTGTFCLVVRSISIKYLVYQGRHRYNMMIYLLTVDSIFWTIIALTYEFTNEEPIPGKLIVLGIVGGVCRGGSLALMALHNPINEHNVFVIIIHVIQCYLMFDQTISTPTLP